VTAGGPARVLLINQYFWPDVAATAQLLAELAEDLGAGGATVTALAGRGSYVSGPRGKLPRREEWRGVEVRRVRCTSFGRGSTLGRVTDYLTFLAGAKLAVLFGRRRDVVICLSTPPLVGVLGWLARLRGARFVYKVEDLYRCRDDARHVAGGFAGGARLGRPVRAPASARGRRGGPRRGDGEGAAGARRTQGECDPELGGRPGDPPRQRGSATFRRAWPGRALVVLYSGNLGLAHRFDAVLAAATSRAGTTRAVPVRGGGPRLAKPRRRQGPPACDFCHTSHARTFGGRSTLRMYW
jgi:hypothetical protein